MNVIRNALKPGYLPVITRKILDRFYRNLLWREAQTDHAWYQERATSFSKIARDLDPDLWEESQAVAVKVRSYAEGILKQLDVTLGGGAYLEMLYFLTRRRKPEYLMETGVAAGYSTRILLQACRANGIGHLFSSDFPYFRLKDPEQFIGILVDSDLKDRWTLRVDGDRKALPYFLSQVPRVDLFHYDSDKQYAGRRFVLDQIRPYVDTRSIIVMDDIADNNFFRDYVSSGLAQYKVFQFEGKFIGMVGDLT